MISLCLSCEVFVHNVRVLSNLASIQLQTLSNSEILLILAWRCPSYSKNRHQQKTSILLPSLLINPQWRLVALVYKSTEEHKTCFIYLKWLLTFVSLLERIFDEDKRCLGLDSAMSKISLISLLTASPLTQKVVLPLPMETALGNLQLPPLALW
jgi:hypothetical protein